MADLKMSDMERLTVNMTEEELFTFISKPPLVLSGWCDAISIVRNMRSFQRLWRIEARSMENVLSAGVAYKPSPPVKSHYDWGSDAYYEDLERHKKLLALYKPFNWFAPNYLSPPPPCERYCNTLEEAQAVADAFAVSKGYTLTSFVPDTY